MCNVEHVLGGLVEDHHVVLLDVHLVDGPGELTIMITTFSKALNCKLRIFISGQVTKCPEVSYYVPPPQSP